MKSQTAHRYTQLEELIFMADDRPAMEKLLLDEVGVRQAWRVIRCLNSFKGFEECFWKQGGDMPEECRDEMFNAIANLFRDTTKKVKLEGEE